MMTLFSTPKPFRGHINIIQRNAIHSWTLLKPKPEIILIGNEEGAAEVCKEFGLCHLPEVELTKFGTPLVSSLFGLAQTTAANNVLCYVNADIVFINDFLPSVQEAFKEAPCSLLVGRRWDLDLERAWDFERTDWQERIREYVHRSGHLHGWTGIDYFVFPRGLFSNIPPFAVGRTRWDNWLIYYARSLRIPVINATESVLAIHQNHDYSHRPTGEEGVWTGEERRCNLELSGGTHHAFNLSDATHVLTRNGLKAAVGSIYLWRRLYTLPVLYPFLTPLQWLLDALLKITRPLRLRSHQGHKT